MNYDQARAIENKETGEIVGWRWTTMNDGHIRTAWPCTEYIGDKSDPEWYLKPYNSNDWKICEPHVTQEEAEKHFYDACLGEVKESNSSNWMDCIVCGAPTKRLLGNRDLGSLFNGDALCDEHFGIEALKEAHPFKDGLYLMHS